MYNKHRKNVTCLSSFVKSSVLFYPKSVATRLHTKTVPCVHSLVISIYMKGFVFISFYTQTQHITGTGPFTCQGIEDDSLVTTSSVVTKLTGRLALEIRRHLRQKISPTTHGTVPATSGTEIHVLTTRDHS